MFGSLGTSDLFTKKLSEIREAFKANDLARGAKLIESNILESWYGLMPDELNEYLAMLLQEQEFNTLGIQSFYNLLNVEKPVSVDLTNVEIDKATSLYSEPMVQLYRVVRMRTQGESLKALELLKSSNFAPSPTSFFFDESRGWNGTFTVQYGITALLAGDVLLAIEMFEHAQMQRAPGTLPFITRDAYVKHALVHAAYGDPRIALISLQHASEIPRTDSWVEPIIDASAQLAEILLQRDDEDFVHSALKRIPLRDIGEMWPFYLIALHRSAERFQRRNELLVQIDNFEKIPILRLTGSGLTGSVIPLVRATTCVLLGDLSNARKNLQNADKSFVGTRICSLILEAASGQYCTVITAAKDLAPAVKQLRQLNLMRLSLLLESLLKQKQFPEAIAVMKTVLNLPGELAPYEIAYFSKTVRSFAEKHFEDWPMVEGSYQFIETLTTANISLSKREIEILELLATNLTRQQLAEKLFLSLNTIKKHLSNIYEKLEVANREEAISEATRKGFL